MSNRSRKWTWMIVGAGVVAVAALPERSLAQCNSYSSTYATQPVRIDYGPAYRGQATYTTVARPVPVTYARPYVQPAPRVVRTEPVYAPVQYEAPVVVYVDNDRHYRPPTRRIYRTGHHSRRYVTSPSHGHRGRHYSRHHSGHRRPIVHRSHSRHGRRGVGVSISAGRSHHGRRHGGVSFSYRR